MPKPDSQQHTRIHNVTFRLRSGPRTSDHWPLAAPARKVDDCPPRWSTDSHFFVITNGNSPFTRDAAHASSGRPQPEPTQDPPPWLKPRCGLRTAAQANKAHPPTTFPSRGYMAPAAREPLTGEIAAIHESRPCLPQVVSKLGQREPCETCSLQQLYLTYFGHGTSVCVSSLACEASLYGSGG